MGWFRLECNFSDHPKVSKVGLYGEALFVRSIGYASEHETDGFIPVGVVRRIAWDIEQYISVTCVIESLVSAGLWHEADGGYEIHDYLEYQESKSMIEAKRVKNNTRQALNRDIPMMQAIRTRDNDRCRYCGRVVNFNDRRSTVGGTYDLIEPDGGNYVDNLVVACRGCSIRKEQKTPEQASMRLLAPGSTEVTSYKLEKVLATNTSTDTSTYTKKTTTDAVTSNQNVTSYPDSVRSEPCAYEATLTDETIAFHAGKLSKMDADLTEEWVRRRLRESYHDNGDISEEVLLKRFVAASKAIQSACKKIKNGYEIRETTARYVAGVFRRTMQGGDDD